MGEYKDSPNVLIADVDCTSDGKSLCNEIGVRGYPTIKYGDPSDLQDYKGGRSFDDLKKHAETLGPTCGPGNLDLCDEDKKKTIAEFVAMGAEKRAAMIKEKDGELEALDKNLQELLEGLQKQYKEASEKKEKDIEAVKNSGLGLLKSVHAHEKKAKTEL